MTILEKLDRVEHLLVMKHQPGRHNQQLHDPTKGVSKGTRVTSDRFLDEHGNSAIGTITSRGRYTYAVRFDSSVYDSKKSKWVKRAVETPGNLSIVEEPEEVVAGLQNETYTAENIYGDLITMHKVPAGGELGVDTAEVIRNSEGGTSRLVYNTETRNWHVAEGGYMDIDHDNFGMQASEGVAERGDSLTIQVRGMYNADGNKLYLYDFYDQKGAIASATGMYERGVEKMLSRNLRRAERAAFTVGGEEPEVAYISFNEVFLGTLPDELTES